MSLPGPVPFQIDSWLEGVRLHVRQTAPDCEPLLAECAGEVEFGASIVADEIALLPPGSRILEIGAGPLLMSSALQAAGYRVLAVEPTASGFSHLGELRRMVMDYATRQGCAPHLRTIPAEQLDIDGEYDFAFSINVMEHVSDVAAVLNRVWRALAPGGAYRFVCPNYRFPYEPHFDIPTLLSKSATGWVFRRRILGSRTVLDPQGTWDSLNWISIGAVRRICEQDLRVSPEFDALTLYRFVRRAIADPAFQRRHSPFIRSAMVTLDRLGLTDFCKLVPVWAQPAMSCRIARPR